MLSKLKRLLLLAYLSHYLAEGHLFEVGGFATHVGARNDDKIASLRNVAVVRDVLLSRNALQNGVATPLYCQRISELRTYYRKSRQEIRILQLLKVYKENQDHTCSQ